MPIIKILLQLKIWKERYFDLLKSSTKEIVSQRKEIKHLKNKLNMYSKIRKLKK